MVRIKCFDLRDDIFDQILSEHPNHIKIVDNIEPYMTGYHNKQDIYYDGNEYMICLEYIVNSYTNSIKDCTEWKQCRCRKVSNTNKLVDTTIDGSRAWVLLMRTLDPYYTWDEIQERLHMFEAEYNDDYKQMHHYHNVKEGYIVKIDNCIYYDINGAHNDALIEIFPKAKQALTNLYISRHDNPNYKAIVNYGVGMLCRKGFRKTYNWIVQRTTKTLYNALKAVEGTLLYVNTDGFVIRAKNDILGASKELGKFKIEYSGEVYIYQDKNYWLIQMGNIMKGSCLTSVRKDIDLSKGQVVHYIRRRIPLISGQYINVADYVEKEDLSVPKKENLWEE